MIKLTNPAVTSPIRAVSNREKKLNTYASCIPGIIATEVNTATVVPTCKLSLVQIKMVNVALKDNLTAIDHRRHM